MSMLHFPRSGLDWMIGNTNAMIVNRRIFIVEFFIVNWLLSCPWKYVKHKQFKFERDDTVLSGPLMQID